MAIVDMFDLEHYGLNGASIDAQMNADGWLAAVGITSTTATVRTGTYAAALAAGDSLRYRYPSDPATIIAKWGHYQTGSPAVGNDIAIFEYNDGAAHNAQITIGRDTNNAFTIKRGATTLATSAPNALIFNNYMDLQVFVTIDQAVGKVIIEKNAAEILRVENVDTRNHASQDIANQVYFPRLLSDKFVDGFVFLDTTGSVNNDLLPGETQLQPLEPSGVGDVNAWTVTGAATNWEAVDDGIPDDDTTYNQTSGSGNQDLFAFDDLPAGANSVYGIRVAVYAKRVEGGAAQIKLIAKLSGTTIKSDAIDVSAVYQRYSWIFETKPGGGNWSPTDVNNAQFGYEYV
jgi:hypothetical protein